MKKNFTSIKSILGISLAVVISLTVSVPSSAGLPSGIWKSLNPYTAAKEANDYSKMLEYGQQVVDFMKAQPDSADKLNQLANRYFDMGDAAEKLKDYSKAAGFYEAYIPYAEKLNWKDGVNFAKAKVNILKPEFEAYVESDEPTVSFNAKFEPKKGVYYGANYQKDPRVLGFDESKIRKAFPNPESMYLVYFTHYDEIGKGASTSDKAFFESAKKTGTAIEFAWNIDGALPDPEKDAAYIKKVVDYLGNSGCTIFLRFACEMNVNDLWKDGAAYKKLFIAVAKEAKQKSNIAMVWSPNDVGSLDKNLKDFYPGDEYVDWVGISNYVVKYFMSKKDHGEKTAEYNTYFYTGDVSNPILKIRPIVNFMTENNIKKPVMLAEAGVSHYINTEKENTTDWALIQLRKMYEELPRYFPQIKAMVYFNVSLAAEKNEYAFYKSEPMNSLYNQLVKSPQFITKFGTDASVSFKKVADTSVAKGTKLNLSAVSYYPYAMRSEVKYTVDGAEVFKTEVTPYKYTLDTSALTPGAHKVVISTTNAGKRIAEKTFTVTVK